MHKYIIVKIQPENAESRPNNYQYKMTSKRNKQYKSFTLEIKFDLENKYTIFS